MAATDVNGSLYDIQDQSGGFKTVEQELKWVQVDLTDTDIGGDLAEDGDIVRACKFKKGTKIHNVAVLWGAHDSGGTPTFAAHLSINAAVDGNAAASFILISSSTKGQAGGYDVMDTGAVIPTICNKDFDTDDAYLFLENDVAPATATATRTATIYALISSAAR